MEKSEFQKNAADMIYLTACSINGIKPEQDKLADLDMHKLFEVCQKHILTACTAYALESAGIKDNEFTQAKEKAVRKNILLDVERGKILKRLEAEKIWYMPLKGSFLHKWYPKLGMRQMSDNDILCDSSKRSEIKDIMLDMGFSCEHYGKNNDDAYYKPPVCNFEMHNELFTAASAGKLHEYYEDVKNRLVKDENNDYGYHFTDEDFYIYLIAHEYKHFITGGTGVRSLVDTYVFMKKFSSSLNHEYLDKELEKLGIADFERSNRELAMKVFSMEKLSEDDKKQLDYYVTSGIYGNYENRVKNGIESKGSGSKAKYILYRFFPPVKHLEVSVPWAKKSKLLIPAAYIFRLFRNTFFRSERVKEEVKQLKNN